MYAEVNGARLFYERIGSGPALLIMHGGLGLDHSYLRPWLDPLGADVELIYYDHRANGRSRAPAESLTMEQLAADPDALLAHLGIERAAVLGHSYGGYAALQLALSFPDRVSHLVLCDTAAAGPDWDGAMARAARLGASDELLERAAHGFADEAGVREWLEVMTPVYFPHSDPDIGRRVFADVRIDLAAERRGSELLGTFDAGPRLDEIRAPTLVVAGRDDFLYPPQDQEKLRAGIHAAELVLIEGSGHLPFVETQQRFLDVVRAFLTAAIRPARVERPSAATRSRLMPSGRGAYAGSRRQSPPFT
jgi:proline iminopeptidase